MSEPDVSDLLTVAQAIDILDAVEVTPRAVELPLGDADGLVLAEPIVADRDYPPFDKSLMDGFAVRSADAATAPVELKLVGEIAAGQEADRGLARGETMAIMTGAPLPPGADGVIPVEDSQSPQADRVTLLRAAVPGRYIARRGSDVRHGQTVLSAGTLLGPAQLAVAASVGAARVKAFAKPTAAVLATGDELVPIDATPGPAQIRNSNSATLVSLLERLGCDVVDLGVVRDEPALVRDALADAMRRCDVLFVTGGMSMGAHDHVPRTLRELGVDLKITKLRIKPGKPFVFGTKPAGSERRTAYVFGLPGNPVSGFVCTLRLAVRLLARLRGTDPEPRWLTGRLIEPLPANGPREFYLPAILDREGGVVPLLWKGSADVFTLASADALLVRGENEPAREAGDAVRVLEVPS
jgi:molybdopterin molybdotransferase